MRTHGRSNCLPISVASIWGMRIDVIGGFIQVNVMEPRDIRPFAEHLFDETKEREFAPQRPHAVGLETELERAPVARAIIDRKPNLAEAAFAEFALEDPLLLAGDRLTQRRPPPERLLIIRPDDALGFF